MKKFSVITDKTFKNGGQLIPIDFNDLPFVPKRAFVVTGVNSMELRGDHAHIKNKQILICISGKIIIYKEDLSGVEWEIILNQGDYIFHPNLEWLSLGFDHQTDTLLSLCSEEYDENDYIRNYQDFEKFKGKK